MSEFEAKKLGEVLAFSRVGAETLTRARTAAEQVFGDTLDTVIAQHEEHAERLVSVMQGTDNREVFEAKGEATGKKLRAMRDQYLADEEAWNDPAEILEWLGFFEGAALVHWSLVRGIPTNSEAMRAVSGDAFSFHRETLDRVVARISEIPGERTA